MIKLFRKRLFWKFFFSYFALILISMMVLLVIIRILLPGVFNPGMGWSMGFSQLGDGGG